jgi:aldehyde dehydrogenase (NAD+)
MTTTHKQLLSSEEAKNLQLYVDGSWRDASDGKTFDSYEPATGQVWATIAEASPADIDAAIRAARRAFEGPWAKVLAPDRARILWRIAGTLDEHREELAQVESRDNGKAIRETRAEIENVIRYFEYFAGMCQNVLGETMPETGPFFTYTRREPVGVVGAIIPWNSPLVMLSWKVCPAIAGGNTIVLKPAEDTPVSALMFAKLVHELDIPPGVINVVPGFGSRAGDAIVKHPDVDKIAFTGSTEVGKQIARTAAETLKLVTFELGGKSPNIVFADADLEDRVTGSVLECFNNSGQSCDAPTRMLVERGVYDQVVEIAKRVGREAKVGDPTQEGGHIGPLVSHIQFGRVQALIEAGIAEGARLLVGGAGKPEGFETGYFVKPTIFADVNNTMRIAREEVFGPVLAIMPFETEEEAIEIANDTNYGLAAYVQTGDPKRAERVASRLRAGMVHINGGPHRYGSPFGGYKQSGNGREGGMFGLEDFLEVKTVHRPDAA